MTAALLLCASVAQAQPSTLTLTWTGVPGAWGYRVDRAPTVDGPWTEFAATYDPRWSDPVNAGTSWCYRVSAWNDAGLGTPSSGACATAQIVVEPPPPPQLIANAGFESPSVPTYRYNPPGAGWTFSATSGVQANGGGFGAPAAPEGRQTAFVQQQGSVSQAVTLPSSGAYELRFRVAQRQCCSAPYTQTVRVLVDGAVIGTVQPGAAWQDMRLPFTTSAGTHTVRLEGTATADRTAFVDAVTITLTQATGVALQLGAPGLLMQGGNLGVQ